jgi:hypothetical protein
MNLNLTTHEVPARQTAAPVLVQANEPFPGLHVYQQPSELWNPSDDRYTWRLAHHSGLTIAAFEYPGDADETAWAIHHLTDWTRTADQIRADIDGDTIRDAVQSGPGIFLSRAKSSEVTP